MKQRFRREKNLRNTPQKKSSLKKKEISQKDTSVKSNNTPSSFEKLVAAYQRIHLSSSRITR